MVRFCEINLLTARLLDLLVAEPTTGRDALARLAVDNGLAETDDFRHFGRGVLENLRGQGILLGCTYPKTTEIRVDRSI